MSDGGAIAVVLVLVIAGGIAFWKRCEIFPSMCNSPNTNAVGGTTTITPQPAHHVAAKVISTDSSGNVVPRTKKRVDKVNGQCPSGYAPHPSLPNKCNPIIPGGVSDFSANYSRARYSRISI